MRIARRLSLATVFVVLSLVFSSGLTAHAVARPSAPSGLKSSMTSSSATLSWSAAKNAKTYAVCLTTNSRATKCVRTSSKSTATKVTLTKLTPTGGRDYFWRVYAYNTAGHTSSSKTSFDLAAPAKTKLAPATKLKQTITTSTATLSWSPAKGAKTYSVCLLTNGTTSTCYRASSKRSATTASFSGLKPTGGKDYYWYVGSYGSNGFSKSTKVSFDLATGPIDAVTVTEAKGDRIALTWPAAANADKYQLQIAQNAQMTYGDRIYSTTSRTLALTGLRAGRTYFIRVRPLNGSHVGTFTKIQEQHLVAEPFTTSLMTYNLCGQNKCVTSSNGMKKWTTRKAIAGRIVRDENPDVVATQESHSKDTNFGTELKGYTLASYYSAKALYYRTSKFNKLKSGTITLNSSRKKYAVWALLQDKATRNSFIAVDAHLQSKKGKSYDQMRESETKVLVTQITRINATGVPVVYAGDYNSNINNADQDYYKGGYDAPLKVFTAHGVVDSIDTGLKLSNEMFNSANQAKVGPLKHRHHVDHIYVDPVIDVTSWRIVTRMKGSNYSTPFATDHNPLFASMTIPGQG